MLRQAGLHGATAQPASTSGVAETAVRCINYGKAYRASSCG
jgi:hypothetical protein